jgi:hypothetical protein
MTATGVIHLNHHLNCGIILLLHPFLKVAISLGKLVREDNAFEIFFYNCSSNQLWPPSLPCPGMAVVYHVIQGHHLTTEFNSS